MKKVRMIAKAAGSAKPLAVNHLQKLENMRLKHAHHF